VGWSRHHWRESIASIVGVEKGCNAVVDPFRAW
jgi:hypothetical protein